MNSIRIQIFKLNQCLCTILLCSVKIDRFILSEQQDEAAAAAYLAIAISNIVSRTNANLLYRIEREYIRRLNSEYQKKKLK